MGAEHEGKAGAHRWPRILGIQIVGVLPAPRTGPLSLPVHAKWQAHRQQHKRRTIHPWSGAGSAQTEGPEESSKARSQTCLQASQQYTSSGSDAPHQPVKSQAEDGGDIIEVTERPSAATGKAPCSAWTGQACAVASPMLFDWCRRSRAAAHLTAQPCRCCTPVPACAVVSLRWQSL